MKHLLQVSSDELEQIKAGKTAQILKSKRNFKVNDELTLEQGEEQLHGTITGAQEGLPGLTKNFKLITFKLNDNAGEK